MDEISIMCPITKQIFSNPVVADDGNVYEKDAILDWLNINSVSPITRQKMSINVTQVNIFRTMIENFLLNNPQLKENQYTPLNEFKRHKSKVYEFIKENKFDELLNYHYYDYDDLRSDEIVVNWHNGKTNISYLHYIFKFCKDENILKYVIDSLTKHKKLLFQYMCTYLSEPLIIQYLSKFEFSFTTDYYWNAFHFFAKRGFNNAINLLFEKNLCNHNEKTSKNYTPLMMAIKFRQNETIKLLIDKMICLDEELKNSDITFAIKCETQFEIIKYMIDNCKLKNDILFWIIDSKKKYIGSSAVIKYLINLGIGLDYVDDDDDTVLHIACKYTSSEIIVMIAQNNLSLINKQNIEGYTPWMVAIECSHFDAFIYMIKQADHTIMTNHGSSLIHWLAQYASYNTFNNIINEYKLDINAKTNDNRTPLHYALTYNSSKVCELIINQGGDVNCPNDKGKYPIHYALKSRGRYAHLIELLLTKVSNLEIPYNGWYPIHYSAKHQSADVIRLLIDKNVNLEVTTSEKSKPIHILCEHDDDDELIKYLIDVKKVDIESEDVCGFRVIHYVCWKGSIDLIKYIIGKTKDYTTDIRFDTNKCTSLSNILIKNTNAVNIIKTFFNL